MNKFKLFILLLPFMIMCAWALSYDRIIKSGTEVVLPITGYDPRNLLSGHYIEFQIAWSQANCYQADWKGACPRAAFNGVSRYYIPESSARTLERFVNNSSVKTEIVFAYKKGERPLAKRLLINGQSWQNYLNKGE